MGLFDPKYHGTELPTEHGRRWQDSAEQHLRELVKLKDERIAELERKLARANLDLAVATGKVKGFSRAGGAA